MSGRFQVGVARRAITPPAGVELAGLGYYLERKWERIRDGLNATAAVIGDGEQQVAIVALDLMWNDSAFTGRVRALAEAACPLRPGATCVNFSHTHNGPTAGLILGAGEQSFPYLNWAAAQAAEALVEAWRKQQPARLFIGHDLLPGMTFNRTRENGPVDQQVSVLRAETMGGAPLLAAVNFHSHCTAHMEVDLQAVSRDWPGELVDQLERAMPGTTAMYLQGTCGDVNFKREYNGTEKRFEPARALLAASLRAGASGREIEPSGVGATVRRATLPTRRWTEDEIAREREEGLYRLRTGDTSGWMEGLARVCVNQPERLPLRYGGSIEKAVAAVARFGVEWTDRILPELHTRPEKLDAEVQALRIGDVQLVANPSELFTTLGLQTREEYGSKDLLMLSYSNGSIGYLPDAYDVERGSYAALQSPKFTGQFPFTKESGLAMVEAMLGALDEARRSAGA